jgi:cyclopropane-fatty-acyl-phospholipid synthase
MNIEKLKNIHYEKRTHCVVCGEKTGEPLIELPDFPMTEIYSRDKVTEKVGFVDQSFHFCVNCGHGQIANVIDIELQYDGTSSYNFRTSESATGRESGDFFVDFVTGITGNRHFGNVVEIGCNDLYMLKKMQATADRLTGIDPILKGREKEFSDGNITAVGDFFENVALNGDIDVVLCKDALEHVSDPKRMVEKIVGRAQDNTLFFFQFPLLETLLAGCRFDQIFHQHLNYFSLRSIMFMLNELGCELMDYRINSNHWGAILIAFRKKRNGSVFSGKIREITADEILDRYAVFKNNMEATGKRLSFLEGEKIYGYGAALMLPLLSYHLKNDLSCLTCIIDDDKRKEGLYYVNLPVRISTRENIADIDKSVILLTAIASLNNVRRILGRLYELNPKQIILPINTI